MAINKYTYTIIGLIFFNSCLDNTSGKTVEEKLTKEEEAFEDKRCEYLSEDLKLQNCKEYHSSGYLSREGKYLNGNPIGFHKYYDVNGDNNLIIDYYPLSDEPENQNQVIFLSKEGDTIMDKSCYFNYSSNIDSNNIISIGENFEACFKLEASIFKNDPPVFYLYITKDSVQVQVSESNQGIINYTIENLETVGLYDFSGFLMEVNYDAINDFTSEKRYYFMRPFYVK